MYYTERFNSYTHLFGSILAVVGFVFLIIKASYTQDSFKIVSSSIYGITLFFLYFASTCYHSVQVTSAKKILQKFDHCAIYLLIAGSYTPFTLVSFRGGWGWSLFGIIWGLAVLGIVQELLMKSQKRILSLFLYLLMGWLVIIALYPMIKYLSWQAILWLALGGFFYTLGVYWYVNDEKIKHSHGIWHLFVLAGSIAHFICIYFYIV